MSTQQQLAALTERAGLPSMSSNARTLACPGWMNLSRGMGEIALPEKPWTKNGALGHDVLAGAADEDELDGHEDVAFAVTRCAEEAERLALALGFDAPDEILIEQRFFLHDDAGEAVASGKFDRVLIQGRRILVLDYKLGSKAVLPPAANPQLIGYALLVAEEYEVDEAVLAIIPAWRKTPPPATIDAAGLAIWRGALLGAFEAAADPDAPRMAGTHCDYCPARAICPEAHAVVRQTMAFSPEDGVSDAELVSRYDLCKQAEGTIKAYFEYIGARMDATPEGIPGLRRKRGAEKVTVTHPAEVCQALLAGVRVDDRTVLPKLTEEQTMSCAKLSLNSIASVLAGGRAGAKRLSKEGESIKATLKRQLGDWLKVTTAKGSIERV